MGHDDGSTVVTYARLDDAARDIKAQADRLDQSLDAIRGKIAAISDLWEGEAREAYNTAQRDWDKEAKAIHTSLTQISQAVQRAAPDYKAGDIKSAQNFH
ncbi:WXG100 family type VII secretion target [Streptomyces sp. H27-C3]|uniref:WXG100 family type VII secretion target n=1 Tax=Streptomyces sp. H27-C3 TaxID=3046305 RepID=UPI0024BB9F5B|nr:WXG100 family type VII secretion target [Streptomyces sp. H27-C3]MDJ0460987.1 WXG100 family type VII secretion target [Streptomyces sp. H27-C3]